MKLRMLWLCCCAGLSSASACHAQPFVIRVVDADTDRPVPMVRLKTVNQMEYVTDSAGVIAFDEPGLMNLRVFFHVESPGYEFPADGFGIRGRALDITPGGNATLRLPRKNLAQRLYRITGQGIYCHSVRAGLPTPVKQPLLNGQVFGQDSTQRVLYNSRIYWFWGDTSRPAYPLGLFLTSGATSLLPADGGLSPDVGIDLQYWTDDSGFSRAMAPLASPGVIWIDALCTLPDATGRTRLFCHYTNLLSLTEPVLHGLAVFNDDSEVFESLVTWPLEIMPRGPQGSTFLYDDADGEWLAFSTPFPTVRMRPSLAALRDPNAWQALTPLPPQTQFSGPDTPLDRDAAGRLRYAWKHNAFPLTPQQEHELLEAGKLSPDETRLLPHDFHDPNTIIVLHNGSTHYNAFRKTWITIATRFGGKSMLGEIYFTEAVSPDAPRMQAVEVASHDPFTFYNPIHHPFFDSPDGRTIYFEGTFTTTFSAAPAPIPRYDYNQLMYSLDLADIPFPPPTP